ncbi:LamG domain-containing protein [Candidatus Saccharibacteria bacterium]|nr:MAG: LamG domain-containing protein [Candidatus Saccharibacteria bacterium]
MALIVEYGFNEGSGTTAADSSGNGYTLTVAGTQWTTGHYGGGIQSNTTNGTPSRTGFGSGTLTTWTWMFWAKRTGTVTTWGQILQDGVDFNVELWPSNEIEVNVYDNSLNRITSGALTVNTWTHIALVRNGSSMQFYVNGASYGNTGNIADSHYDLVRTRTWRVGTGPDEPFPGVIDDVRLFDAALTVGDISTWMNKSVGAWDSTATIGWFVA